MGFSVRASRDGMHGAGGWGCGPCPCTRSISVECMQASVGAEFDSIDCWCAWESYLPYAARGRTALGWDTPPLGRRRRRGRAETGSSVDSATARRGAIPIHMARPARRNRPRYAQAPQVGGHASGVGVDNGRPFVPPSLPSAFAALFRSTCGVSGS